jgi:hypothetical protein
MGTSETKRCGCGRVHDAAAWAGLEPVGTWDDGVEVLELRNCACGSSLAFVLRPSAAFTTKWSAA